MATMHPTRLPMFAGELSAKDGGSVGSKLSVPWSPATTAAPSTPLTRFAIKSGLSDDSLEGWDIERGFELDSGTVSEQDSEVEREVTMSDGSAWLVSHGKIPPTLEYLETALSEVKAMCESQEEDCVVQADGTKWIVTRGIVLPTTAHLESLLADVVDLFERSFWIVTRGYIAPTPAILFKRLAEVQAMYHQKFEDNQDVIMPPFGDRMRSVRMQAGMFLDERVKMRDGSKWIVTRGGITTVSLEQSLAEVKQLYKQRFEYDGDEPLRFYDGSKWVVTHGSVPPSTAELEKNLAVVKGLLRTYTHRNQFDSLVKFKDGSSWLVTRGSKAPTASLLQKRLLEVKTLYKEQYGENDDAGSDGAPLQPARVWTHKFAFGRGLFGNASVSKASKWDRKQRWALRKNRGFSMDGSNIVMDWMFMNAFMPSVLASSAPKNAEKRRQRRSSRFQVKLGQEAALREREHMKRLRSKDLRMSRASAVSNEFE